MTRARVLLESAMRNPASLRFDEMVQLADAFGFRWSRHRGSHHTFSHTKVRQLLNLQEVKGMAGPYRVRQSLKLLEKKRVRGVRPSFLVFFARMKI